MSRIRKRISALRPRLPREQRIRKRRKQVLRKAIAWKDKEVKSGKRWTPFEIPFHQLEHFYNLLPDVFQTIKDEFRAGPDASEQEVALVPAQSNVIPRDILADFFFFKYWFSVNDFTTAKRLEATLNRCKGSYRNGVSAGEKEKWPARPDVFLNCPNIPPNAGSMDDMAGSFRYEKFNDRLQKLEQDEGEVSSLEGSGSERDETLEEVICLREP